MRSQMIALLGNFVVAFPVAVLICWPFAALGTPFISVDKAQAALTSLHGLKSLSFVYAAIAGVCLFVSGLQAGAADNWLVFNKVGRRLKTASFLGEWVGEKNLDRAIQTIDHNLGFWVGNIVLGFLLGSMAAFGKVVGLPLDIRHITFASAQFSAAIMDLKFDLPIATILAITVRVFIMGLINLAVSFSLTMYVVICSRKIRFAQTPELLRGLWRHLRQRPQDFFWPSSESR